MDSSSYNINAFSYILKVWSCILILILLPLDFLFRIDAFLQYLSPIDVVLDTSVMIIFLFLISLIIAILAAGISFAGNFVLKGKITSVVFWINNVVALAFTLQLLVLMSNKWANNVFQFNYKINYDVLTIIVLGIAFVVLVIFKDKIDKKIKNEVKKLFKIVIVITLISIALVTGKALTVSKNQSENKKITKSYLNNIKSKYPNVILITFDALTANDMSLYGYQRNTTPYIDAFAKESYVFDNMYANCNFTTPSVISILTGKYPSTHRAFQLYAFLENNKKEENIGNLLRKNGYQTAAIISNTKAHPWHNRTYGSFDFLPPPIFKKEHRFRLFFNIITPYLVQLRSNSHIWVEDIMTFLLDSYFQMLNPRRAFSFFTGKENSRQTEIANPSELTFKIANDYLRSAKSPFFLWIHVFPPHGPYLPSRRFKYTFLKEKTLDTRGAQSHYGGRYERELQPIIDKLRDRYDEMILDTDYEFHKFLASLKKSGYFGSSIIMVSSDHGEAFEKEFFGHGGGDCSYLYQPLIYIPLIIHMPNQKQGKRITSNAEQIDIVPTILDVLVLNIPDWMEGESLRKAMEENYISSKPKFSMDLSTNNINGSIKEGSIAVMQDRYKFIYYIKDNRGELYDLAKDKKENNNLADLKPDIAAYLKKLVLQKIKDIN